MCSSDLATPALKNLMSYFRDSRFSLLCSASVAGLFKSDPNFAHVFVDDSKKYRARLWGMWKLARRIGRYDLSITFRNSFSCALLLKMTGSNIIVGSDMSARRRLLTHPVRIDDSLHQAEIYNQLVNRYLGQDYPTGPTSLYLKEKKIFEKPTIGIAPGATYGDAKRWGSERFGEVAAALADRYDILILGAVQERPISEEVENELRSRGVHNYRNEVGKTTVEELAQLIAGLSLFISNDSGQMHIAGVFHIPTVAIFGPTIAAQTSPWKHAALSIVRKDIPCAPCMKRTCPLKHHECMRQIQTEEVLAAVNRLVGPG